MAEVSLTDVKELIAAALFNEGERRAHSFVRWSENEPSSWRRTTYYDQADAVLEALGASEVCATCGCMEADCRGTDYWGEHSHDYSPLIFANPPVTVDKVGLSSMQTPSGSRAKEDR